MSATPDSTLADPNRSLIADLQRQLAECRAERDEALRAGDRDRRGACRSSIPRPATSRRYSIRSYEKAHALCEATSRHLLIMTASCSLRRLATRGILRRVCDRLLTRRSRIRDSPLGAAPGRRTICPSRRCASTLTLSRNPAAASWSRPRGIRTSLCVTLAQGRACSAISALYRQEVRPFSDKQIALLRELRGAGGDRDGERAADHRDARGTGAADRDRRGVAGHQLLARRPRAGVRRDVGKGACGCAESRQGSLLTLDGERFPARRGARSSA